MKNQQTTNFSKIFIIPTIVLLALAVWYHFTESVMEQLLILFISVTVVAPVVIQIFAIGINYAVKPVSKESRDVNNIINKPKQQQIHTMKVPEKVESKPQEKKPTKVNPSEYYMPTRDAIIACTKNNIFNRQDISTIVEAINTRLGGHVEIYNQNFKFENDLHRIYCTLKSSALKSDDYIYLLNVINSIVASKDNLEKEEVQ